jgi:hypothetical protein
MGKNNGPGKAMVSTKKKGAIWGGSPSVNTFEVNTSGTVIAAPW